MGIFTERDLLTRVSGEGPAADETDASGHDPAPITVEPKDPVRTAIRRMQKGGYRHLPVVDEEAVRSEFSPPAVSFTTWSSTSRPSSLTSPPIPTSFPKRPKGHENRRVRSPSRARKAAAKHYALTSLRLPVPAGRIPHAASGRAVR